MLNITDNGSLFGLQPSLSLQNSPSGSWSYANNCAIFSSSMPTNCSEAFFTTPLPRKREIPLTLPLNQISSTTLG